MTDKLAPAIMTASGRMFDYEHFTADDICIEDIAHALSRMPRFGGHTVIPYSVAQHSLYVSDKVPTTYALEALLHDATEAYLLDVPRPLKALLKDYQAIEKRVHAAVAEKFGVPLKMSAQVKEADERALATEGRDVCCRGWRWDLLGVPPYDDRITQSFHWAEAKVRFLTRFYALSGQSGRYPYGKITRDNVPQIIGSMAEHVHVSGEDLASALQEKIAMDATILHNSVTRVDRTVALAEILDTIDALLLAMNIPMSEVDAARIRLTKIYGGFKDGSYLKNLVMAGEPGLEPGTSDSKGPRSAS